MQLFQFTSTSPSSSHDLFFCQSCALFSLGPFVSLFSCSRQRIAKSFTQKLPLGKGFDYAVTRARIPQRLRNTWHLPSGGCHTFFWTYIYIYIYIYLHVRESRFQWYSLLWGSFRLPNNNNNKEIG